MALAAPMTWTSTGVTAAQMNAQIKNQFNQLLAVPTTYVTTWAATSVTPVVNNGTLAAEYWTIGNKFVNAVISLTIGSTTTVGSGQYSFTLPFTPAAGQKNFLGAFFDTSAPNRYPIIGECDGTTTMLLYSDAFPMGNITAAAPVIPATGDRYHFDILYRIA